MYRWYRDAAVCYVFLTDYEHDFGPASSSDLMADHDKLPKAAEACTAQFDESLGKCKWFTRGWTLQELIAPRNVYFYDSKWRYLATKAQITDLLCRITNIARDVLINTQSLKTTSIADKMSWTAHRNTTREEDRAYSLLGLFDINMPLLYGEGSKAFKRLQEEVIRNWPHADHSILAHCETSLFATSPSGFSWDQNIVRKGWARSNKTKFDLYNHELRLQCPAAGYESNATIASSLTTTSERILVALNCVQAVDAKMTICIVLRRRPEIEDLEDAHIETPVYEMTGSIIPVHVSDLYKFSQQDIAIARHPMLWPIFAKKFHIQECACRIHGIKAFGAWDENTRIFTLRTEEFTGGSEQEWRSAQGVLSLYSDKSSPQVLRIALRRDFVATSATPMMLKVELDGCFIKYFRTHGAPNERRWYSLPALQNRETVVFEQVETPRLPVLRVFAKYITIGDELLWSLAIQEIAELHAESIPLDTEGDINMLGILQHDLQ